MIMHYIKMLHNIINLNDYNKERINAIIHPMMGKVKQLNECFIIIITSKLYSKSL